MAIEVLLGQHLGRHHERPLVPAADGGQERGHGHHRLARADVALQETVHGERPGQLGEDGGQGPPLGPGQLEGEAAEELADQAGPGSSIEPWPPGRRVR